jgi:hypothetical protein
MKIGNRSLLMIGGMLVVAPPAFAQPANLLSSLGQQPATAAVQTHNSALAAAHDAVEKHQWGAAEAELERSETLLLNGGIKSPNGVVTSPSPAMAYVIQARTAVEQRDQVDALLAIDKAMSTMIPPSGASSPVAVASAPASAVTAATPVPAAVASPMVTKALLPGHWQLAGWQYHWVPPDTNYRTAQTSPFIPGHYEYRGGAWIWVAGHYGKATS